jgi:putative addiction module component (TIGR02574 family)
LRLDNGWEVQYFLRMPATLEALSHDALILPPDQRLALACQLLESVDPAPDPDADLTWEKEIQRRIASLKNGEVRPIPAAEVLARLRQIAPDR